MRRIVLLVSVAAMMAVMLVSGGPAYAGVSIGASQQSGGGFGGSSSGFVVVGGHNDSGDIEFDGFEIDGIGGSGFSISGGSFDID